MLSEWILLKSSLDKRVTHIASFLFFPLQILNLYPEMIETSWWDHLLDTIPHWKVSSVISKMWKLKKRFLLRFKPWTKETKSLFRTDVVSGKRRCTLVKDVDDMETGAYDKPLPCFGCGIGWFSWVIFFFVVLVNFTPLYADLSFKSSDFHLLYN